MRGWGGVVGERERVAFGFRLGMCKLVLVMVRAGVDLLRPSTHEHWLALGGAWWSCTQGPVQQRGMAIWRYLECPCGEFRGTSEYVTVALISVLYRTLRVSLWRGAVIH